MLFGRALSVERVHENERDGDTVLFVDCHKLLDGEVDEGLAVTNLEERLRSSATHRGTETTVQLQNCRLTHASF